MMLAFFSLTSPSGGRHTAGVSTSPRHPFRFLHKIKVALSGAPVIKQSESAESGKEPRHPSKTQEISFSPFPPLNHAIDHLSPASPKTDNNIESSSPEVSDRHVALCCLSPLGVVE
jgi:hypothetical protein